MSDTRKITIEILQTDKSTGAVKETTQNVEATDQKNASNEGSLLLKSVILNQGYNVAKKSVINAVNASINNYIALSEDYMAENTYNAIKTSISKATSIGGSLVSSAMAGGMVAGLPGAVAGFVIGGVGTTFNELLSYQSRMSSYYQSLNATNISKDYARRRSGYTDNGKGTDN